jgi:hypothetical protein
MDERTTLLRNEPLIWCEDQIPIFFGAGSPYRSDALIGAELSP